MDDLSRETGLGYYAQVALAGVGQPEWRVPIGEKHIYCDFSPHLWPDGLELVRKVLGKRL